jgi:type III secretion protein U
MSEKTEQPTSKKLRDARNKGQVAQSKDLISTALLLAMFFYVMCVWKSAKQTLESLITLPGTLYQEPFPEALRTVSHATIKAMVDLTLPALGLVLVFGVASAYFQVGPLFVFEPLKPDLKKLNPADKLKQMFSMKNFVEFLKSCFKTVFLGILLYIVTKGAIGVLVQTPAGGLEAVNSVLEKVMYRVALFTSFAYVALSAADFAFQKWQHTKGLMMSKDEVKREYKEMEGDPHIKSKRKQLAQELIMSDSTANVRKATVLVTNPTHKAIAIYYKQGETKLPIVTAKGEGYLAQRMIEVAKEEGVPIMQNVPLAHELFDNAQLEHYIPAELIEPIAEVLRWVQQLAQERP